MADNTEFSEKIRKRTKLLAIETIKYLQKLPATDEARTVKRQLLRSVTSVAANYRAACRARSTAEFYAKLSIAVEEADETTFWFEIIQESGITNNEQIKKLNKEAEEILAILSSSRKTLRDKYYKDKK